MQVTLGCILCELLPLVDLEIFVMVFCTAYALLIGQYLCNLCVCYYNFTTTFQLYELVQPINADIVTLVNAMCELWPLMDLQIFDKSYQTVTTTIF